MTKASRDWAAMKRKFKGVTGVSDFNVTLRRLSLGSRDNTTGWRNKTYTEHTIEMLVFDRSVSPSHLPAGVYARLDAVGLTRETTYALHVGDEIKAYGNVYYEIKGVRKHYLGSLLWFYECDLTELPMHD